MFSLFTDIQAGIGPAAKRVGAVCDNYASTIIGLLGEINYSIQNPDFDRAQVRVFRYRLQPAGTIRIDVPLDEEWELDWVALAPPAADSGFWIYTPDAGQLLYATTAYTSQPITQTALGIDFPTGQAFEIITVNSGMDIAIGFKVRNPKKARVALGRGDTIPGPGMGMDHEAVPEQYRRFTPHTLVEAVTGFDDGDHRSQLHSEGSDDN